MHRLAPEAYGSAGDPVWRETTPLVAVFAICLTAAEVLATFRCEFLARIPMIAWVVVMIGLTLPMFSRAPRHPLLALFLSYPSF